MASLAISNGNTYHLLETEEIEMSSNESGQDGGADVKVEGSHFGRCVMTLTITSLISLISVSVTLAFCTQGSLTHHHANNQYAQIIDSMDQSIDPCEDFYGYACGGWRSTQEIPTGHSKWNTFNIVEMENKAAMKEMLENEDVSYKGQESSAFRKTKDYYKACMDLDRIELLGASPLKEVMLKFGGWPLFGEDISVGGWNQSSYNLTLLLAAANKISVSPFLSMWVGTDDRNSSQNIVQFEQSGLGLQYPEMYESPSMDSIVEGYKVLGAKTAAYLHRGEDWETFYPTALSRFQEIIDFEIEMSHLYLPKSDLQDPASTYHKMPLKEFADMFPLINMSLFMQEVFGEVIPLTEDVIVYTPSFFPKLTNLLTNTPEKLIVDYFMWQLLQPFLTYVSLPFENLYREFQAIVSGTPDLPPRWQRCVSRTDSAFGFATGAMFVETILPHNIKEAAVDMIAEVKSAFIDTLPNNEWMDNTTRERAREKAEAVVDRVGHPEWIESPESLDHHYLEAEVDPHQLFNNYINMRTFTLYQMLHERGKPANSSRWDMTPAAVNAYYNPSHNQIVFPSGIFQRPFYSTQWPMSMNFGGIGMVMGHELTHGFDNQGKKFDKNGNLYEWWEADALENFKIRSQCMADQYQQYTVDVEDMVLHVDGNYTLPENIADNGGLVIAYKAYQSWKTAHPAEDTSLPGLSLNPDQLYFLGFAQIWCSFETPEHAHLGVLSDQHAPDKYRVVGSISNSVEFAEAFSCPAGSAMNPRHKCKVW